MSYQVLMTGFRYRPVGGGPEDLLEAPEVGAEIDPDPAQVDWLVGNGYVVKPAGDDGGDALPAPTAEEDWLAAPTAADGDSAQPQRRSRSAKPTGDDTGDAPMGGV